jgi:hypothetical protein
MSPTSGKHAFVEALATARSQFAKNRFVGKNGRKAFSVSARVLLWEGNSVGLWRVLPFDHTSASKDVTYPVYIGVCVVCYLCRHFRGPSDELAVPEVAFRSSGTYLAS